MDIELTEINPNIIDCQWVKTGVLPIPFLNDFNNPVHDILDSWHERKIGNIVASLLNRKLTHQSIGNFPEYDIIFNDGKSFEIKVSTFESNKIFIETGTEIETARKVVPKKKPSGLSVTSAYYYILLNPSQVNNPRGDGKIPVMKMRLIKTEELKKLANTTAEMCLCKKDEKKTYGFEIDILDKNFDDGFVGYFEYNKSKKEVNLNRFQPYHKDLSKIRDEYNKG